MQNNYQGQQLCQNHNKKLEYFCFDPSCKINTTQCFVCVAILHKKCKDEFILDEEEIQNKIQFDNNSQNQQIIKQFTTGVIKKKQKEFTQKIKEIWINKVSQIQQFKQSSIDINDLLENKKKYTIIKNGDKLSITKISEQSSLDEKMKLQFKIFQIFEKQKKNISKFDMKIPNLISKDNFVRDKQEIKYKHIPNTNQAVIKTGNFYQTARLISKYPWKNFILEFCLTDKLSQKHSLGFKIFNHFFNNKFEHTDKEVTINILNSKSLLIYLEEAQQIVNKPLESEIKGYFKDRDNKLSLYIENIKESLFEVEYTGNLFFFFKADKQNVNLFLNLIQ